MPVTRHKTGPGTLTLGATDDEQTISEQVTSITISADEDVEDDVTVLSGETVAGQADYTATLSVTMFQDLTATGIIGWSWRQRGEVVPFEFTPNSEAGATWTGDLRVRPIDAGGEVDEDATSDVEFSCVDMPEPSWPGQG